MTEDFDQTLVEYEEDAAGTRVYKDEGGRVADGAWHPLREGSTARYRIVGDRLQLIDAKRATEPHARGEVLALLEAMHPLRDDGVVEVWIGRDAQGYFVRDYRFETDGPIVERLDELTRAELSRALGVLNDLIRRA